MNAKKEFNNAQLLFINGKLEECVASFTKALKKGYDGPLVFLSRGVAYLKMGKVDEFGTLPEPLHQTGKMSGPIITGGQRICPTKTSDMLQSILTKPSS